MSKRYRSLKRARYENRILIAEENRVERERFSGFMSEQYDEWIRKQESKPIPEYVKPESFHGAWTSLFPVRYERVNGKYKQILEKCNPSDTKMMEFVDGKWVECQ